MRLTKGIQHARSPIAFIVGLCLAAYFALSVESGATKTLRSSFPLFTAEIPAEFDLVEPQELTLQDWQIAQTAWTYFERNTQEQTGLVNSVNDFPSTTIWDQASYLLALISAQRLELITIEEFDQRMGRALTSLSLLELFDGQLPNKAYDTRSLKMTDYDNAVSPQGIGWSALDVARISVPLNIVMFDYPQHSRVANQLMKNWNFSKMLNQGTLMGSRVNDQTGLPELVQEGRLGYEEYGARAVALLGLDALTALRTDDYLRFEDVEGVEIAVDSRSYLEFDAHNYVVSEPYILTALEFGFDRESFELARRIYEAQENRFENTGIFTAVSEDNIDQAPYFLYNTVFANGKAWNTIASDGSDHDDKRTVSTKAAIGWNVIFDTEYTNALAERVMITATSDQGFYSGIYEADGSVNQVATANTNAIILEALQFKANGPLVASRFLGGLGS